MMDVLLVGFFSVPFVVAVLLALGCVLLGLALYTRFGAGCVFVALVAAMEAAFGGGFRLNLGINVYAADLTFGLLAVVALLRWLGAHDAPRQQRAWLWALAAVVFGFALGSGLLRHGTTAGVQARDDFYALAAALYFASFRIDDKRLRQFFAAAFALALVFLLVAAYRWTVVFVPIPDLLPPGGAWTRDGTQRVIPSNETLLLAQMLILGLVFAGLGGAARSSRWIAPILLAVVVALQHRSVWAAALAGFIAALALARASQGHRLEQLAALVVVAVLAASPLFISERGSGLQQQIGQSASTALGAQGTMHSRLQDWRQTAGKWLRAGPQVLAVGNGFGADTARIVITEQGERRRIAFGLHNHYLSVLVNSGMLGMFSYLAIVFTTAFGLYRQSRQGDRWAPALLSLLVMCTLYYIPYGVDYLQHAGLGLMAAYVATRRASVREAKLPRRTAADADVAATGAEPTNGMSDPKDTAALDHAARTRKRQLAMGYWVPK